MKRSKLNTKIGFISSVVVACALFLASCDTFETDPDLQVPEVELEGGELVVMSNGSTFIDLAAQVKSDVPIQLSVTSLPQNGTLTDLGKGLLEYQPNLGSSSTRDSFEFSVYSLGNILIIKDTIIIIIVKDSTQLPCGVYTSNDFVYGFSPDSTVTIPVLANDFICSIDTVDVRVSIYRPDETFPPYFGNAFVVNNNVVYTSNQAFENKDKVIYKIQSAKDSSIVKYGLVHILAEQYIEEDSIFDCTVEAFEDSVRFTDNTASGIELDVLRNDVTCDSLTTFRILVYPLYGNAEVQDSIIYYQRDFTQPNNDHLEYEICNGVGCSSAQVYIKQD